MPQPEAFRRIGQLLHWTTIYVFSPPGDLLSIDHLQKGILRHPICEFGEGPLKGPRSKVKICMKGMGSRKGTNPSRGKNSRNVRKKHVRIFVSTCYRIVRSSKMYLHTSFELENVSSTIVVATDGVAPSQGTSPIAL